MTHDQNFAKKVSKFWKLKDNEIRENDEISFLKELGAKTLIRWICSTDTIFCYSTYKRLDSLNGTVYRRRYRIPYHSLQAQLAMEG